MVKVLGSNKCFKSSDGSWNFKNGIWVIQNKKEFEKHIKSVLDKHGITAGAKIDMDSDIFKEIVKFDYTFEYV